MGGVRDTRGNFHPEKASPKLSVAPSEQRCLKCELATQNSQGSGSCQRLHVSHGQTLVCRSRRLNQVNVKQSTLIHTVKTDVCFSQGLKLFCIFNLWLYSYLQQLWSSFKKLFSSTSSCMEIWQWEQHAGTTFVWDILVLVSSDSSWPGQLLWRWTRWPRNGY